MLRRSPLKRGKPLRRTAMRRGSRKSKYARRERDFTFLGWVKTQLCSVLQEWPDPDVNPGECHWEIQADHDSQGRGLSQKSDDHRAIPMCMTHHGHRTDHNGAFKHLDRASCRAWFVRAVLRTQTNYLESNGIQVG